MNGGPASSSRKRAAGVIPGTVAAAGRVAAGGGVHERVLVRLPERQCADPWGSPVMCTIEHCSARMGHVLKRGGDGGVVVGERSTDVRVPYVVHGERRGARRERSPNQPIGHQRQT